MIDTAARSSRRMSSIGSVYASAIPAPAAAFCAFSRERLQMAATSQPSDRKPGTWTCAPKPTPMMPIFGLVEGIRDHSHELRLEFNIAPSFNTRPGAPGKDHATRPWRQHHDELLPAPRLPAQSKRGAHEARDA